MAQQNRKAGGAAKDAANAASKYVNGREIGTPRPLTTARDINARNEEFWETIALRERVAANPYLTDDMREALLEHGPAEIRARIAREQQARQQASAGKKQNKILDSGRQKANELRETKADGKALEIYRRWERLRHRVLVGKNSRERVRLHLQTYRPNAVERRRVGLPQSNPDKPDDSSLPERHTRRIRALLKAGKI